MPYKTKSDLPESVKHVLPSNAQDIYTLNNSSCRKAASE